MTALPSTESPLKIYYVPEENLYFFKRSIAEKYGTPIDVTYRFRFWADPRPIIPDDLESILDISNVENDLKRKFLNIVKKCTSIVNVVNDPNLDLVKEFMVNGDTLCTINYDMWRSSYIMILNRLGAAIYVNEGYKTIKVDRNPFEIDGKKVEERELDIFPIVDSDGRIVGSCIVTDGRVRVVRKWEPVTVEECLDTLSRRRRTLRDIYETNIPFIEEREIKVKRVVEYFERKYGFKGILSFSGGKDSLLALILLLRAESNFNVIHVSIENADPPSLCRYIDYIEDRLGIDIVRLESKWDRTRRFLDILNMPSRGNRWCTPLLKFVPLLTYIKNTYDIKRIISYIGSRKSETIKRRIRPATYIDSEAGLLTHAVCYKFPRLLEYLYIWYRAKIRLFEDYLEGIERLSCITCPFKSCIELIKCEQKYSNIFELWEPYIEKMLKIMIRDSNSIRKAYQVHLWRFYMLHCEAQYIAARAGVKIRDPYEYQRESIKESVEISEVEKKESRYRIVLKTCIDLKGGPLDLVNNISTLMGNKYRHRVDGEVIELESENTRARVNMNKREIIIEGKDPDEIITVGKLIFMSLFCIECNHCYINCENNCIEIPFRIRSERCTRCLHCLDSCVPYRTIFDMIIYAQLTSIKRAHMRMENIREKYKEILIKMRYDKGLEWLRW